MTNSSRDDRLLELARRLLDGEAIDWSKESVAESEVREGMKQLERIIGRRGEVTETKHGATSDAPVSPAPAWSPRLGEDRVIGGFRLVRKLGEGGMGVVYEAEQRHPRRVVALKVIRGGALVSPDTLKLFRREIQTLARLNHSGIAQLYETGITDDGMHFFAMELVHGEPLSDWLRSRPKGPITPAELKIRLGVFRKICDAVAYAHQKGVIHRDLKPGNILIPKPVEGASMQDAVPEVKVLDFGLARITDSDVQATTFITEMGKVQGTLPYMSPEQVRGNPDEIDLRTDVYALGVILYEMVTGRLPYDISKAQLHEAVRIICEAPPRSLSATFSGTRRLDADVATIAIKSLEKEASRRYQSAAALGEDVQRYLANQPILARPPSAAYQFRKLVLRHKGPFAAAAAAFVLLAAFAGAMTVQAARIARERDRANQAAKRAEDEAKRATEEAGTAKSVSDFLEGMFKDADPAQARGATITAKEILDRGAAMIQKDLADQPIVQMRLVNTMFRVYDRLGLGEDANRLVEATAPLIDRYPDRIESAELLAWLVWVNGGKPVAIDMAKRSLEIRERVLAPTDPRVAWGYYFLGDANNANWRLEDASRAYATGLARLDAADRDDLELRIWLLTGLGINRYLAGDGQGSLDNMRKALTVRERFYPPDHPERLMGENHVAYVEILLGEFVTARPVLTRVIREQERVLGKKSPFLGWVLQTLAELERREGHFEQAKKLAERSLHLAKGPPETVITLALAEEGLGRPERTLRLLESDLEERETSVGSGSPDLLTELEALRGVLSRSGRSTDASKVAARAERIRAAYQLPATAGTLFLGGPAN